MADKRDTPPPGYDYVPIDYWEHVPSSRRAGPPVNGHWGVFAYHNDDCQCSVWGDHYCNRDGRVWSCCGSTQRYCHCAKAEAGT